MKIKLISSYDGNGERKEILVIYNNQGKILTQLKAFPLYETPEDATLDRDMLSCSDIIETIKLVLDNLKEGEEVIYEEIEEEENELY